jgi:hypothetical protein
VNTASLRLVATEALLRLSDRLLATLFLLAGALLVYLVLFDQGAAAGIIFGSKAGHENLLHEFFHDGRHFFGAPCH